MTTHPQVDDHAVTGGLSRVDLALSVLYAKIADVVLLVVLLVGALAGIANWCHATVAPITSRLTTV